MTKLTKLTPEQQAAMPGYAQQWINRGHRTGRLTDSEWAEWERGAKACYEFAGIRWPGVVVRVPSPLVGAFAAPIAAYLIAARRGGAVNEAVNEAVHGSVAGAVNGAVRAAVNGAVDGSVADAVDGSVADAVDDAVRGAVHGSVADAVDGSVADAVDDAVRGAVHGSVADAVDDAVDGAVRGAVHGSVADAVHGSVADAVDDAVDGAVRGAVHGSVRAAVGAAVGGAVGGAVDEAVGGAVADAVGGAVAGAVHGAVAGAVDGAVHGAIKEVVKRTWHHRLGGGYYLAWEAWKNFFRDHCETDVPETMWDRSRAYEQTLTAGWWWPHRDFVIVADRPDVLTVEQVSPTGWGSHRLHSDSGPAIGWATDSLSFWHGVRVPADPDLIREWSLTQVMAERNTEVRRACIEIIGWDRFVDALTLVAECDDPGNAPHTIRLFDLPGDMQDMYEEPARILVVSNASLDKGGHRRVFGIAVPASHEDPLAAAADLFDIPVQAYAQLAHAS